MRPAVLGYSSEPRLRAALAQIRRLVQVSGGSTQEARALLRDGLPFAPADARLYSMLGILAQMDGRDADAQRLFHDALRLAPAEQVANLQLAVAASAEGRRRDALGHVDILLTRWPSQLPNVEPVLLDALADPPSRARLVEILRESPPWRAAFMQRLGTQPATVARAGELLFAMLAAGVAPSDYELRHVVGSLVTHRQVAPAYQLFLATLGDEDRALVGYVFDSEFKRAPKGLAFEWRAQPMPGVEVSFRGGDAGARIAFHDVPVTYMDFQQTLALSPGRYKVAVESSGEALSAPRGLNLVVRCGGTLKPLLVAPLPLGDYRRRVTEREFDAPGEACESQEIAVASALTSESWALRQSGALILHSISVEPAER